MRSLTASSRLLLVTVAVGLMLILALRRLQSPSSDRIDLRSYPDHGGSSADSSAANATLGFEKIMVINMATRFDRRDMYTLLGASYDLDSLYHDGVPALSLTKSPGFFKQYDQRFLAAYPYAAACFRAHAEVWRRVIDEGWSSVLILEADADFDPEIKLEMQLLSQQMTKLVDIDQGPGHQTTAEAPYTRNWDVLYVGHCGDALPKDDRFVAYDDPTVPAFSTNRSFFLPEHMDLHMAMWKKRLGWDTGEKFNKRVVQRARGPACTHGYAITRRGAMRLLHSTLFDGYNLPVDLRMRRLVMKEDLVAYSVMSPLFCQYRYFDSVTNSDMKVTDLLTPANETDLGPPGIRSEELVIKLGYGPRKSALRSMSGQFWHETSQTKLPEGV